MSVHVVLVHGAGGSPSTWSSVAPLLRDRRIPYTLADNAMTSLRDDEATVRALVDGIDGPVLLVGHSYGGAVITNAGTHDRVVGLVYVAAFAPDAGESVSGIVETREPALVSQYMHRGPAGEWIAQVDEESRLALAWDVPEDVLLAARAEGRVTADAAFQQPTGEPAWRTRPSWYLVATSDRHLLPAIQRDFVARMGAVVDEVDTSHAVAHAAPDRVVAVIESAVAALR
ncbi:alpha/beta hydrolase [Curtobacterium sp. VKM Ac-2887]|uniref:alpha/beta hydrolase n=1 Tax=Curtobacterium sp. VKM Ac-2887 TaxID=2783819 RepID=UPI00188BD736|nr:alpha/beta hydrolase [Curtobacterium sp. VKM Ac-2887]MBF4586856.1 alpha/beta hydrolase [Curtobacterium sp. VKM Ac-2887]